MARVYALDRVLLTTSTAGTGSYQVSGAALPGFLSLAQAMTLAGVPDGATVSYVVVDSLTAPTVFEEVRGVVTLGSTPTLTRAEVIGNSLGTTSPIIWPSGTRYVFGSALAKYLALLDTNGRLSGDVLPDQSFTEVLSAAPRSIPSATSSVMFWDTLGGNSLGAANGVGPFSGLTAPQTGTYEVMVGLTLAASTAGTTRLLEVRVGQNQGVTAVVAEDERFPSSRPARLHTARKLYLSTGQSVFVYAYQDAGAPLAAGGTSGSYFTLSRVRG